jgi:hypothetical protein
VTADSWDVSVAQAIVETNILGLLVQHDRARRWAERDGRYEEVYAAVNPGYGRPALYTTGQMRL